MRPALMIALAAALAGCGQSSDNSAAEQASTKPKPKRERPPYCFFKSAETKGWAASRGKDGNIVVRGKAYRQDSRYQAQIGKMEVTGTTAIVRPTVVPNMTGYGAPNDWWDIKQTIPDSRMVEDVSVRCGEKTIAELKVKPAK